MWAPAACCGVLKKKEVYLLANRSSAAKCRYDTTGSDVTEKGTSRSALAVTLFI